MTLKTLQQELPTIASNFNESVLCTVFQAQLGGGVGDAHGVFDISGSGWGGVHQHGRSESSDGSEGDLLLRLGGLDSTKKRFNKNLSVCSSIKTSSDEEHDNDGADGTLGTSSLLT